MTPVAARTIWDTRIQCVVAVVAAREGDDTELWICANFGQASLDPPRIVVNPNRLYPIEGMIRRVGRFSLNIMTEEQAADVLRLLQMRRREPRKTDLLGWRIEERDRTVCLPDALQSVTCEVETVLDTGDHTVMVARVLSSHSNPRQKGHKPLLYPSIAGRRPRKSGWEQAARTALNASGLIPAVRALRRRRRQDIPANLPEETYRQGGQTESEIAQILSYGVTDRGRALAVPRIAMPIQRPIGVCVVGTHWGATHVEALRSAAPNVRIFLCGRDETRTAQMAGSLKSEGYFVGLDKALNDPRVEAVTLALPHHLHRDAAIAALSAGKHVLVEKPIATTLADADAMLEAGRRSGKVLMVAENMHYRPTLRAVCERIIAGDCGEPLHVSIHTGGPRAAEGWVADAEKLGGGVFMDIGIHYVRAMRLLLGEPDRVSAFRAMQIQTKMGGEDGLTAVFTSSHGWTCQITTTWTAILGNIPDIVVLGDQGTFHLWPLAGYYDFYAKEERFLTEMLGYVRPYWLQAKLMRPELQRERVKVCQEDTGYPQEMAAFLEAVGSGHAGVASAEDARRDLEIVLDTYRAARSGMPENIRGVSA